MPRPENERDFDRVQSVFLSVADLPPQDQVRQLDAACDGDSELRAEVESLLESDRVDAGDISSSIANEAARLFAAGSLIGYRLGAYRVMKEIGRGGMGDVYLAVRDDDQFHKQVAIKVVRRGMDTADVLGRFRHERQILANLDHPYIARLLDGGTTPDGLPFFVMEYVEGQSLEQFCERHQPDVATRCQLFLRILEAVAHAHRNLVVHRDLKPSNIFVTADGSPKLLDFGVAKLVDVDSASGVTASLGRPFTPEYASPEQVLGLPVTTTSDIYSLGALFYELLTGQRAQPIAPLRPAVVEQVVCHSEIPRPSLITPGLDSDLDNIVLMAMRKDPHRRYQSVDQLADDIRRHLSGRPVLARQESLWYTARKFAGRNRFQIAGAGLILASLLAALVISLVQSRHALAARQAAEVQRRIAESERAGAQAQSRMAEIARAGESAQRQNADRERDEAVRERARAEQRLTELLALADKALFGIHDAVARLPGATEARKDLVKTTLDYLESIEKDHGLDDRVRLALGAGYTKIAAVQGDPGRPSLGDYDGARLSYQKAEGLLAPLILRQRNDPKVIIRWLEVESGLAKLLCAHFKLREGIEKYQAILPAAHRLALLLPADPNALQQEGAIEGEISQVLQPNDIAGAREHSRKQIALLTAALERFPRDRELLQQLGVSLAAAATSFKDSGDFNSAADYFERSIRIREEYLQADPNNVNVQRNLLVVYGNYGTLLGIPWSANLGRFAEARAYCEKSVALARKLSAADPQDQTARFDLAMSLAYLGMIEPDAEHVAESMQNLEEALALIEPMRKANPKSPGLANQVALMREYAGYRSVQMGRSAEAARYFRAGLAELEPMIAANPDQVAPYPLALANEEGLAEICAAQGDRAGAMEHAQHVVTRAEQYFAVSTRRDPPVAYLAKAYLELALVDRTLGDWDGATEAAAHARSLFGALTNPGVVSVHRRALEQLQALTRELASHGAQ